jgi:uncharacterized protein (TIGR02594 family)
MGIDHRKLFGVVRQIKGRGLTQAEVDAINAALAGSPGTDPVPAILAEARKDQGLREIPGVRHAPRIMKMIAMLGYPFSDDETPWCGTAMAAWAKQAGFAPPPQGYRAISWASWGVACAAQLGAIGVKQRQGGNHVFLIVGETIDRRYFKVLGANQSNMVNVMDIAKSDVFAIRWPSAAPQLNIPLPVLPAGILSSDEA